MTIPSSPPPSVPGAATPGWYARLRKNRLGVAAFWVVVLYFLCALGVEIYDIAAGACGFTPVYAVEDPNAVFAPPSLQHWFGTDYLGRDCFWRAVGGVATAVKVGTIAALIAAVIGVLLGTAAGYYGGRRDELVVWLYSVFAAMPTLLFILAFALLFTRGFLHPTLLAPLQVLAALFHTEIGMLAVYLAIGLTGWVTLCRVIRAETMKLREQTYVQAARVAGVSDFRIILRHILPNVRHLVVIYFTLRFAYAIMTEVIVSYLGLGVQHAPSWGVMISDGQERLWRGVWWEVGCATLFMFVLVLALNILGDALRDMTDPKNESRDV